MTKNKFYFEEEVFSKPNYKFKFESDDELIEEILKYQKSGDILDLGCGEGGTALRLAELGFNITCVDISKTAMERLKKESEKRKIRMKIIYIDLSNYKIEDKYDIIICTGVLHFIEQKSAQDFIKQIREHTNKDGVNILDVLTGKEFFKEGEIKKAYSDWKIIEFESYKEKWGVMNYLFAMKS